MKYINNISLINRVLIVATVVLYATIYLGVLCQIFLGSYQLIIATYLWFQLKEMKEKEKSMLFIYSGLVFFYGFLLLIMELLNFNSYLLVLVYIIIPISLAIYFSFLLENIRSRRKIEESNLIKSIKS
ncbi:hypothetical protein [Tenacibaculum sp. 190524A02b]|uniref:hypothetical protein n=1 Tax=Tenacibaculum vairaonense TaxID=3137860 RepID=UPI0031FB2917